MVGISHWDQLGRNKAQPTNLNWKNFNFLEPEWSWAHRQDYKRDQLSGLSRGKIKWKRDFTSAWVAETLFELMEFRWSKIFITLKILMIMCKYSKKDNKTFPFQLAIKCVTSVWYKVRLKMSLAFHFHRLYS